MAKEFKAMINDDKLEDEYIFVSSIRLRNGKRIFASSYGKRAFRIKVPRGSSPGTRS